MRRAYETGRGVVRMRGKVEIGPLEGSRGRQAITVVELPYGVGAEKVIAAITNEVTKTKRLTGIADVKDLTDRESGTRLVVECKVGVTRGVLADLPLTPLEHRSGHTGPGDGRPYLGFWRVEVFLATGTRWSQAHQFAPQASERLHLVDVADRVAGHRRVVR